MANLEYESLDMNEIAIEAERVNREPGQSSFSDKLVKLPERDGFVLMRLLPRLKGQKLYCATRTHRLGQYPDDKSYHCPRELVMTPNGPFWVAPTDGREDCVICKYYKDQWQKSLKLAGKAQEDLQAAMRVIKPIERYYYNVIVREAVNPKTSKLENNVGPLIFSCGKTVHAKIMAAIVGDVKAGKKAYGDITNPTTGRDFRLVKKIAKGNGKEYPSYDQSEFEFEPTPLGTPEQLQTWLANAHDLSSLRVLKDHESLRKALKQHLGVLPAEKSEGFDASEFENGHAAEDYVGEKMVNKPLASQKKPENIQKVEDELMADPDFLNEFNDMQVDD